MEDNTKVYLDKIQLPYLRGSPKKGKVILRLMKQFSGILSWVNNSLAYALWVTVGEAFQRCCFPHKSFFSGTQWVWECTCWSKGNWALIGTISLFFGPNHICEVGLRNPPFFFCICFSPSEANSWACKRSFLTVSSGVGLSSGHSQNWAEVELKADCLAAASGNWFPSDSIESDLECPGISIPANF